jgi:hypothetical protein
MHSAWCSSFPRSRQYYALHLSQHVLETAWQDLTANSSCFQCFITACQAHTPNAVV